MAGLATVFVFLRLWARALTRIGYGPDDWMVVVSLLFVYGTITLSIIGVYRGGTGMQLNFSQPSDEIIMSRADLVSAMDTAFSLWLTFQNFYPDNVYRIFPTATVKISVSVVGPIVFLWWVAVCLVAVFQCRPIQKAWGMSAIEGRCINKGKWYFGAAVPNIVTDIAILTVPIWEIWRLRLPNSRKVGVASIFLLGGFVIIISGIRASCLLELNSEEMIGFTARAACVWWWSNVEISVGCVCACLPTLRPLARFISGRWPGCRQSHNMANNPLNVVNNIGGPPTRRPPPTGSCSAIPSDDRLEEDTSVGDPISAV
ncbi:uncharacterized protein BJX67DRAFT_385269 [Aspergillus lucknowensis]|uniref:Rhodopsin domain-containing protein n=1 Tax=Aspergillus lucknowensis TaxID=176173 RepID=A0ABR4LE33_9EURO